LFAETLPVTAPDGNELKPIMNIDQENALKTATTAEEKQQAESAAAGPGAERRRKETAIVLVRAGKKRVASKDSRNRFDPRISWRV
jgi:hypothetical protein